MNEKRFSGAIEKLRSPDRRERMQVERVINYSLAGIESGNVLDVGTGTGLFAEVFVSRGMKVKGVDCNSEFLQVASDYVPSADFRVATAEKLPFDKGQFDLVFMGLMLHEADDPVKAVNEASRVCRKRLAILEWPYEKQEMGPPLEHRISTETIRKWGDDAGFPICDVIRLKNMQLVILDR